jgi:hypothetical protein
MFHVCRTASSQPTFMLAGDIMQTHPMLGHGAIDTDLAPKILAIWLQKSDSAFYEWQICVDTLDTYTPFGTYMFTDQSGDTYSLMANTPFLHSVYYSSDQPFVTSITVIPAYSAFYLPGDRGNAPACSTTMKAPT